MTCAAQMFTDAFSNIHNHRTCHMSSGSPPRVFARGQFDAKTFHLRVGRGVYVDGTLEYRVACADRLYSIW